MTPEKKKLLAEALGYEAKLTGYDWVVVYIGAKDPRETWKIFNPESNLAQREEVLLWLMGKGWTLRKVNKRFIFNNTKLSGDTAIRSKDYTTALMMAAEAELG